MDIVGRKHERRSFATPAKTGHTSLASGAVSVTGGVRSFLVQECNMFYLTLEPLEQSALRVSLAGIAGLTYPTSPSPAWLTENAILYPYLKVGIKGQIQGFSILRTTVLAVLLSCSLKYIYIYI